MKKKMLMIMLCVGMTAAAGAVGVMADETAAEESTETEEEAEGFSKEITLLYDELDELVEYVPMAPIDTSSAETLMQVTGYVYTFTPVDDSVYHLTVEYVCGSDEEDSALYMKRTYTYEGAYTADGDVYTLDVPEHVTMVQETAGQFAASSGEGGADYWGPDGLEIDETFANEENYNIGPADGAALLAKMEACTVTVADGAITEFAPVEGAEDEAAETETEETTAEAAEE